MEQEKPFGVVHYVVFGMLAVAADAASVIAWIVFAIPAVGQIFAFADWLAGFAFAGLLAVTLFMKLHTFGKAGIANLVGAGLNTLNIPAVTITTFLAFFFANHPELAAAGPVLVTGGMGAVSKTAARAGAAVGVVAGGEGAAGAAAKGGVAAEKGAAAVAKAAPKGKPSEAAPRGEPKVKPSALGEKEEPMETAKKELVGEAPLPEPEKRTADATEEEEEAGSGISEAEMGLKEAPGEVAEMKELEKLTKETPKETSKVADIETARKEREDKGREEEGGKREKKAA